MSFLAELKRRNVFRVAALYLVSSWLVLQVADVLFGVMRLPDWTLPFVAALLALGFLPALVFSWVYEVTPEGIRKEAEVDHSQSITPVTGKRLDRMIIVLLAGVIVMLLVDRYLNPPDRIPEQGSPAASVQEAPVSDAPASAVAGPDLSVAVLPFANLSSDAENEYFADGLTEELLNVLAQVGSLKVTGRTSSFYFKDRNEDLKSIGRQLGVAHVVEGSVRKAGRRVRVTAQLIKVDDGFHLWSDTYDRDLDDIFAIQDEISAAIADALKIHLGVSRPSAELRTSSLKAYELYLQARGLIASRSSLNRAMDLLQQSLNEDPGFADAWASLAQVHSLAPYYTSVTVEQAYRPTVEAADRALAIDPNHPAALSAKADALRDSGQWLRAEELYRQALELNPSEVEANSQYAQLLARVGFLEKALPYARKARELDPLSPVYNLLYGHLLTGLIRFEEAEAAVLRGLELAPDFEFGHLIRFTQLVAVDRLEQADIFLVKRLRSYGASDLLVDRVLQAWRLVLSGDFEQAGQAIESALARAESEPLGQRWNALEPLSVLAAHSENWDLAIELMNRSGSDSMFNWGPHMGSLRRQDVFVEHVKRQGLPDYWSARGWPEFCEPQADGDFSCH